MCKGLKGRWSTRWEDLDLVVEVLICEPFKAVVVSDRNCDATANNERSGTGGEGQG